MPHLSDAEIILLVLAGFYLFECFYLLPEGTLALSAADSRHFRLFRAPPYFASQRGGVLLSGVYPWSQTFLCSSFPVSLDREGAYSYTASALSWRGRGLPECRYVRFDDGPTFRAVHNEVQVSDVRFLQASTPHEARLFADRLTSIAQTPGPEREAAIAALLAAHTDAAAALARLAQFRSAAMPLSWFGGLLLADTFLVAPLLLWTTYDHPAAWKILGAYLSFYFLLWGLTVTAYWKLHRTIEPDRTAERRKHALMMLVSPATAMRGLNSITVNLLSGFHPLAVARSLLSEDQFRTFARLALRDVRQPLRPVYPSADPQAVSVTDSFRAALQAALERLVAAAGLDVESLLAPPAPEGPDSRAWCPRCEQQYALAGGVCSDCGGIELVPFSG